MSDKSSGGLTAAAAAAVIVTLALLLEGVVGQCLLDEPVENKYSAAANHLAIARADMLEFLTADGTVRSVRPVQFAEQSTALAYDAARGRMFLSDSDHDNASTIYQMDLDSEHFTPLVTQKNSTVNGLAFHAGRQTLFWTTGSGGTIGSIRLGGGTVTTVIGFGPGDKPTGIAIDTCGEGTMFWTNSNPYAPSIGRSDLDGKRQQLIVTEDLHQPLGIAVDHDTNHLFWIDDRVGIHFQIESCHLDGSHRKALLRSTFHQPHALAVGPDAIFYADWSYQAIWSLPKDGRVHEPTQIHKFLSSEPIGLVAQTSSECRRKEDILDISAESTMSNDEATTIESWQPDTDFCLNGAVGNGGACECAVGFSGPRCERPACFNFCVNGKCSLDVNGTPRCQCPARFQGLRCQTDKCAGYCLNGGCALDQASRPRCQCDYGYSGARCELASANETLSNASADNATALGLCAGAPPSRVHVIALAALGGTAAVLALAVGALARKVVVLRRRPRIRKQIIVKKNVTPLTSRPLAGEQCEITIENCCNMNICETPCFEPQLRTSKASSKKEEKAGLLGSMEEEEPSCSPANQSDLY